MTQLTPEHFEIIDSNKAKKFEDDKKSLDNEIKDLDYAIDRLSKITDEIRRTFHLVIPNIYLSRMDGIINKFVDVLANLKSKNGNTELTQNELVKQMIKKGYIEKESDLVNLHLQTKNK